MKITLFGATGLLGRECLSQCLESGHEVTVLLRAPNKLPAELRAQITVVEGDGLDEEAVGRALSADSEGILFAIVYGGSDNPNSCLEFSSAREVLGFQPQDHVSDYMHKLPPEVVAKHAATVWQVRDSGTGRTMKQSE